MKNVTLASDEREQLALSGDGFRDLLLCGCIPRRFHKSRGLRRGFGHETGIN